MPDTVPAPTYALPAEGIAESFPAGKSPAEVTLTQLPDGRLAAAWTAETGEEAGERGIWFAVRGSNGWSSAKLIVSRSSVAAGTFTHAGIPGSPLLYAEGSWLHLWSVSRDGIAGDALNRGLSTDAGQSWRKPLRVHETPLAACPLQTFAAPLPLNDGGLLLPLRRDCLVPRVEWLRLSATGQVLDKQRLAADSIATYPGAIPPLPPEKQNVLGFIALPGNAWLLLSRTEATTEPPRFWRHDGSGWHAQKKLGNLLPALAKEQSPTLLRSRDGRIHLAVGDGAGNIRHLQLTENWLAEMDR